MIRVIPATWNGPSMLRLGPLVAARKDLTDGKNGEEKHMIDTTLRVAAPLVLAAMLTLFAAPAGAQSTPIKVGVPTSLTGPYVELGEEVKRGVSYAVKEINAKGGIGGRQVQVEFADSEANPAVAQRVSERLVLNGYKFLVGVISSAEGLAIGGQAEKWDAIYISTINKSNMLTADACNPRMFRANHSDAMDMAVIEPWLKTRNEKDWAIMAADYAWGRDSAAEFAAAAKSAGKTVKGSYFAPIGTKDYAPYIQQISEQNPQGLWVAIGGRDAVNFGVQAAQFGLLKSVFAVSQSFAVPATIKGMGNAAEGVWGVINYASTLNTPGNQAFVAAWKKEYGKDPAVYETETYVGMELLFAAIAKAGTDDPGNVAKAMEGLSIDTPMYGKVTLRAQDHQLMMPNYIGKVAKVDGELKPVVELSVDATEAMPAPSAKCKMR